MVKLKNSIKYDVIQSPCMTLKAKYLNENKSQVVIFVDCSANKIQIKKAVEAIFGMSVLSVNTILVKGKTKISARRYKFFKKDRKKAIVTFKDKNFAKNLSSVQDDDFEQKADFINNNNDNR